jgi:hypothetical protein
MSIRDFVKDVLILDVQDLSYLYTPRNLRVTVSNQPDLRKRGLHYRIATFFWHTVQSIIMLRSYQPFPPSRILFISTTVNQRMALAPIVDQMAEASWVNILQPKPYNLPLLFAYLLALPFFPLVAVKFLQAKGDRREAFYYVGDYYWFAYGYYAMLRLLLRRMTPKAVVVSNDHIMWLRAFAKATRDENIPTIYLQHASVTERFPPLAFDYALLEGIDALKKYASIGPSQADVFLTGMPKFDAYTDSKNKKYRLETLGLCTNPFDSFEEVKALCDDLKEWFPDLNVIVRPHPRDGRYKIWMDLADSHAWQFSDGKEESSFEFLQRIDANIAGDSSIHLEAVLLDVFPIYFAFGRPKMDWYGFHENGLVEYYETPEAVQSKVVELLEHIPPVRSRSLLYNATVNTKYDGRSTDLTCRLIQQIAHNSTVNLTGWERITWVKQLRAYQPQEASNLL